MDESASPLAPTTNLLPNSAIQQDPVKDNNGEVWFPMGDEDASPSSTDIYDMIDFELERLENQTLNLEDLLKDPTSQSLELKVTSSEMHNASQDLEFADFLNHILQSPEADNPSMFSSSQSLELEVRPNHLNAQSLELEISSHHNSQSLELEVHPTYPNSQSFQSLELPGDATPQSLELEVHPNHPNSQSLELEVHPSLPNSQSFAQSLELEVHPNHPISQFLDSEVLPNNNTSQSLELQVLQNVSTSQSFPNVSNQQHLHAQQCQIVPTSPLHDQFIQSPPPSNKRQKTSSKQCKFEYERTMIMEKRNNIMSHNPSAFDNIINQGKPRIGCHCTKAKCSNRYCSCYKAGVGCSDLCQCKGCSNNHGTKNGGTSSTSNSSLAPRERALITTPSNSICLINERQLGGGFNTLTHNNLYRSATNQYVVYGTPATNPCDPPPIVQTAAVVQPQANPFGPSTSILPPQVVQLAATTRRRVNLYTVDQPQRQHMLMSSTTPLANAGESSLMRLPPRFQQEVNDIYWKHDSRE